MRLRWAFYIHSVPFTRAVLDGTSSLGGSESACVGLARALVARGHTVHVFATQLADDAKGLDHAGVAWHDAAELNGLVHVTWDVFVSLRMADAMTASSVTARLRVLWNQDLLLPEIAGQVVSQLFQTDALAYVSQYHRHQWETLEPALRHVPHVFVTRNGHDADLAAEARRAAVKAPNRIIHISRPERGLDPILAMWPTLRAQVPDAELHLCRYSSMYDAQGWGQVCADYDRKVAAVNEAVGGIVWLGELGKPALYQAIADAAVMWYPGVASFAETSCIAAIEAQACGTPFVGSARGALPETVPSGVLLDGEALTDPAYHRASLAAVADALHGCARSSRAYRDTVAAGLTHSARYTYPVLAAEWEAWALDVFATRCRTQAPQQLHAALYEDDHVLARVIAEELGDTATVAFCDRVIAGQDQTAEDYAERASSDPLHEGDTEGRFDAVVSAWRPLAEAGEITRVLDLASGNGAFALRLVRDCPTVQVTAIDYAAGNVAVTRQVAERIGVSDRLTVLEGAVYDFATHAVPAEAEGRLAAGGPYDAVFIGEFLEHLARPAALLNALTACGVRDGARVVCTMPHGPYTALLARGVPVRRGHVHHYEIDDIQAIFGGLDGYAAECVDAGMTPRGDAIGVWFVTYRHQAARRAGTRDLAHRRLTLRPRPRLTVGILAKDAEREIGRCLESVWQVADELLIGDTGSTDRTLDIAESYDARIVWLPPVEAHEDGFAGARNALLDAATGDWFLWIDTDEALDAPAALSRYLRTGPFRGYALAQTHVYVDQPPTVDKPVRLFQRRPDVRFYGCVHEQPQDGDPNTDILPALLVPDCRVIHLGYLTEGTRKHKMLTRNLPLLLRDIERFPTRRLGRVLWVREFTNHAQLEVDRHGHLTDLAKTYLTSAVTLFEQHFPDPADPLHALARPFYEAAIRTLHSGYEFAFTLAGKQGGLNGRQPAITRFWARADRPEDVRRYVAHQVAQVEQQLTPSVIDTRPVVSAGVAAEEGVPV